MIRFIGSPSKEFEPSSRFPVDFFGADVFAVVVLLLLLLFFATSSPAVLFSVRVVRSRNSTVALKGIRPMDLPLCASRKVAAAMIWRVAKSGTAEKLFFFNFEAKRGTFREFDARWLDRLDLSKERWRDIKIRKKYKLQV